MNRRILLCIGFFFIGMNTMTYNAFAENESMQYEYLKPEVKVQKNDFSKVFYEDEVDGVSLIASMTLNDGNRFSFHYSFRNNGEQEFNIKLSDVRMKSQGIGLVLYEGQHIYDDQNNYVGLGLYEVVFECRAMQNEACVGAIYAYIPENFLDGSKVLVSIPFKERVVNINFVYEKYWMTGEDYRRQRDNYRLRVKGDP